ncbi:T9SS type A sorting domain-containing protein [Psychroserpens sp. MEBiC05023]
MRNLLLIILSSLYYTNTFAQTFEVQNIKYAGDIDKRINIVILGDGYQESEFDKFETDAITITDYFFTQSPYSEYSNYFNAYIIKVPSNESGASHSGTAADESNYNLPISEVDNYFGSSFDNFGIHRALYTPNSALVNTVLANNFPIYDLVLIIVNTDHYGGTGFEFSVSSTDVDGPEVAVHEAGHVLVGLEDEYYPGDMWANENINMTQETDPNLVRWKNWIGINNIGIYQHYCSSGDCEVWYKPSTYCKMSFLYAEFCSVCKEGTIEKFHSLVSPIDSYLPSETSISNQTFPLEFQLNIIQTIPNTIESTWTLNSTLIETNVDTISLDQSDLVSGSNTLTAIVQDVTPLINIDNHDTIHLSSVTWTLENTLGIETVEANNYSISIHPNPSSDKVNIAMENTLGKDINIEIVSIDGKKIKSLGITNNENSQIDISALSTGIYLINFYSNNTLISSKRLIKK